MSNNSTSFPTNLYQEDTLLNDSACQTCSSRVANIQCLPCQHILCCDRCLIELCTVTFINNNNRVECFLCRTPAERFLNTSTRKIQTAGDIQDEYRHRVQATEENMTDDQAAADEEMYDPDLNPIPNDPEYAEGDYDPGIPSEEEKQLIRQMNAEIRRGNREYVPPASEEEAGTDNLLDMARPMTRAQTRLSTRTAMTGNMQNNASARQARILRSMNSRIIMAGC